MVVLLFFGWISLAMGIGTITVNVVSLPSLWTVGIPFSGTVLGLGGVPPYTYAVSAGALPPGLTLGSLTGLIAGAVGPFSFTLRATDLLASFGEGLSTLQIAGSPLLLVTGYPSLWTIGASYSGSGTIVGGVSPFSFNVTSGVLPPGLVLASSGALTGVPSQLGQYSFVLRATDTVGAFSEKSVIINIGGGPTINIQSINAVGHVGNPYNALLAANGTPPLIVSLESGALPTGVSIVGLNLLGTPIASGIYTGSFRVTDGTGAWVVSSGWQITVSALPQAILATNQASLQVLDCLATSTQLFVASPSQGTGLWSLVSAPSFGTLVLSSLLDLNPYVSGVTVAGDYVVRWTVTSVLQTDFVEITIRKCTTCLAITAPSVVLCNPAVTISATPSGGSWSLSSGNVTFADSAASSTTATFAQSGQNIISYTVSGSCGGVVSHSVSYSSTPPVVTAPIPLVNLSCARSGILSAQVTGNSLNAIGSWSVSGGQVFFADIHNPTTAFTGLVGTNLNAAFRFVGNGCTSEAFIGIQALSDTSPMCIGSCTKVDLGSQNYVCQNDPPTNIVISSVKLVQNLNMSSLVVNSASSVDVSSNCFVNGTMTISPLANVNMLATSTLQASNLIVEQSSMMKCEYQSVVTVYGDVFVNGELYANGGTLAVGGKLRFGPNARFKFEGGPNKTSLVSVQDIELNGTLAIVFSTDPFVGGNPTKRELIVAQNPDGGTIITLNKAVTLTTVSGTSSGSFSQISSIFSYSGSECDQVEPFIPSTRGNALSATLVIHRDTKCYASRGAVQIGSMPGGLSAGVIVGVTLGVVVGVIVLLIIVLFVCKKMRTDAAIKQFKKHRSQEFEFQRHSSMTSSMTSF